MTLTKDFIQYHKRTGLPSTYFSITVEFNPSTATAGEVIKVSTFNHLGGIITDVTDIFKNHFRIELFQMKASIDWWHLYCEINQQQKVA